MNVPAPSVEVISTRTREAVALRKALGLFYPVLNRVKLTDYKVRVLITSTDGAGTFTTVGVSGDVVDASFQALQDSVEYLLLKTGARPAPAGA